MVGSEELSQDVNFLDRSRAEQVPFEHRCKAEERVFQLGCSHHSSHKEQANVNVDVSIINNHCNLAALWLGLKH